MTNPGPSVFPQNNSGSSGLPPYNTIPTNQSGPTPTDSTGAIDIWNMPAYLQGKSLWYDIGHGQGPPNGDLTTEGRTQKRTSVNVDKNHSFDINMTAEQVMKQFAAMSQNDPMQFAALQKQLQDGAFYGADTHVWGGWNDQTETALAKAMAQYLKVSQAAGVPLSFRQFLTNTANANININGNGAGATGSPLQLTDPDTLKMYAQKAAQAALGRNLKPGELESFVNEFHGQQATAYGQAAGGKGTVVDKNDPRASAINFVTQNNGQEFGQHQIQGYTDSFLSMFLGGASAPPNVNVDPSAVGY